MSYFSYFTYRHIYLFTTCIFIYDKNPSVVFTVYWMPDDDGCSPMLTPRLSRPDIIILFVLLHQNENIWRRTRRETSRAVKQTKLRDLVRGKSSRVGFFSSFIFSLCCLLGEIKMYIMIIGAPQLLLTRLYEILFKMQYATRGQLSHSFKLKFGHF